MKHISGVGIKVYFGCSDECQIRKWSLVQTVDVTSKELPSCAFAKVEVVKTVGAMEIILWVLLVTITATVKGVVEISPSGVAPVCQVGDQLELTCSVTGAFLVWEFTVIRESGSPVTFMPDVTSDGSSGVASPVTVNSTTFTFSRLSAQESSPLISRMTINHVSESMNGIQISCMDVEVSESATTIIQIVDTRDILISNFSIQSYSEEFSSSRVTILLEWTVSLPQIYYQQLLRNVSINVVPDPGVIMTYTGNRTLQLSLVYNTQYNVSITQPGICGQPNQTAFIELNYSRCNNPIALVNNNVRFMGYNDPALEGEVVTFICPFGLELSGPLSSTCLQNGMWEPDPGMVNCMGIPMAASTTILPTCSSPPYTLQLSESVRTVDITESELNTTRMCCSGLLITRADTATCVENEEWELEATQMNLKNEGMSEAALRTALILVTCVLAMISVSMFIIGFICGHYLRVRRKSVNESSSNPTVGQVEDLELKENVAYVTLRPK